MKSGKELKIIAWDASKPLPSTPIPYSLYIVRDGVNFYIKPVDNTGAYLSQSLTGIGVQSVTGDGVDNSDPNNPVISFPIADDIDDSTSINKFITQLLIDKLNGIQAGAEQNVNADWNAISGDALILNKPNATSDFTNDGEGGDRFIEEQELGTAAYQAIEYFATALQGALADTALQPGDNISELVNDAGYVTDSGVLSVTGDGVDNTDPDNPVLSFPNASEITVTPTGNLTSTDTQSALEELQSDIDNFSQIAGNNGEIQFNDSGNFGASSAFVWDNLNNRLGIGTSPSYPFHLIDNTASNQYRLAEISGNRGTISFRSDTNHNRILMLLEHTTSPTAGRGVFSSSITGETFARFNFDAYGTLNWGIGTVDTDTNLYRHSANTLKTDDTFVANSIGIGTNSPISNFEMIKPSAIMRLTATNTTGVGYSGANLYENSGALAASFVYGNPTASAFTNEFVIASRQADIPVKFYQGNITATDEKLELATDGNIYLKNGDVIVEDNVTATSFITNGGTASQIVRGDGSLTDGNIFTPSYRSVAVNTNILPTDYTVDGTTVGIVFTLMDLASLSNNQIFNLSNSSGGNITINTTSSQNIYMPGGTVTSVVLSDGESLTVQRTPSYWRSI